MATETSTRAAPPAYSGPGRSPTSTSSLLLKLHSLKTHNQILSAAVADRAMALERSQATVARLTSEATALKRLVLSGAASSSPVQRILDDALMMSDPRSVEAVKAVRARLAREKATVEFLQSFSGGSDGAGGVWGAQVARLEDENARLRAAVLAREESGTERVLRHQRDEAVAQMERMRGEVEAWVGVLKRCCTATTDGAGPSTNSSTKSMPAATTSASTSTVRGPHDLTVMMLNIPPRPQYSTNPDINPEWINYIQALEQQAEPRIVEMHHDEIVKQWDKLYQLVRGWVHTGYRYRRGAYAPSTLEGRYNRLDHTEHATDLDTAFAHDHLWTFYARENVLRRDHLAERWPHLLNEHALNDKSTPHDAFTDSMRELWCTSVVYRVLHDEVFVAMREMLELRLPDPRDTWMYKKQKAGAFAALNTPPSDAASQSAWDRESWRKRKYAEIEERRKAPTEEDGRRKTPPEEEDEHLDIDLLALETMRPRKKQRFGFFPAVEERAWMRDAELTPRDRLHALGERQTECGDAAALGAARAKLFIALWTQTNDSGYLYDHVREWRLRVVNLIFDALEPWRAKRVHPEHERCRRDGAQPDGSVRCVLNQRTCPQLPAAGHVGRRALKTELHAIVKAAFTLGATLRSQPETYATQMVRPIGEYDFDSARMRSLAPTPTPAEIAALEQRGGLLHQAREMQTPAYFSSFGKVLVSVTPALLVHALDAPAAPTVLVRANVLVDFAQMRSASLAEARTVLEALRTDTALHAADAAAAERDAAAARLDELVRARRRPFAMQDAAGLPDERAEAERTTLLAAEQTLPPIQRAAALDAAPSAWAGLGVRTFGATHARTFEHAADLADYALPDLPAHIPERADLRADLPVASTRTDHPWVRRRDAQRTEHYRTAHIADRGRADELQTVKAVRLAAERVDPASVGGLEDEEMRQREVDKAARRVEIGKVKKVLADPALPTPGREEAERRLRDLRERDKEGKVEFLRLQAARVGRERDKKADMKGSTAKGGTAEKRGRRSIGGAEESPSKKSGTRRASLKMEGAMDDASGGSESEGGSEDEGEGEGEGEGEVGDETGSGIVIGSDDIDKGDIGSEGEVEGPTGSGSNGSGAET
ncbi:hypothetical protein EDC01DRAFT_784259 [Geopyxis carbonaria]|nr:hypothetical protein EDC01DRAFT_784259 [Geopyxis carbonaria]